MVDIFPFVELDENMVEDLEGELPMAEEYAFDFEKEEFKRRGGRMYKVYGKEAVKIWLWKLFTVPRYRYLIYSWAYGNELNALVGHGYTQAYVNAEAYGMVSEAIEYNLEGYVTDVLDVSVSFSGGRLTIEITVDTPYGEVEMIG